MSIIGQGSSECRFCGAEESKIHFTHQCTFYKPAMDWFKALLFRCCDSTPNMIKALMFDISYTERIKKNTCIVLVATYVTYIWIARKAELTPFAAIRLMESKIMYNKSINLRRL